MHLWSHVTQPLNIGVIGTGETAAAIVVALVEALRSSAFIEVISPYGVIYSRDEGFEENRLFSDPDGKLASLYSYHQHAANWLQLSEHDRREFVQRTDRGVFSLKAIEELSSSTLRERQGPLFQEDALSKRRCPAFLPGRAPVLFPFQHKHRMGEHRTLKFLK